MDGNPWRRMGLARLADTRTMTLDDAKAAFADLAQAQLRIERRAALREAQVRRAIELANQIVRREED